MIVTGVPAELRADTVILELPPIVAIHAAADCSSQIEMVYRGLPSGASIVDAPGSHSRLRLVPDDGVWPPDELNLPKG